MQIKWIGQGGYIISDGNTEICIDPYLSDVVNRIAKKPRMVKAPFSPEDLKSDIVICTHNHLDHVDVDAIPMMKKENMLFLAPKDAKKQLEECGVINYRSFDVGDVCHIGNFEVHAVYADHTVPAIGLVIKHPEATLYFSGDTEYNERLEKVADLKIDVSFICINGKLGNMNVEDAIKLTKIINPKIAIPTHYGMFESNTEDPKSYTSRLACGFELEYNKNYCISEVIKSV